MRILGTRLRRRTLLFGGAAAALGACAAATPRASRLEEAYPPRGEFLEVEGLKVHYVASGPAEAPPVVLLHGATGNLNDMTFDLAPRLARSHRVVAFDRPGLGYTERPAERGWDPAVQARILRGATTALGLERPVVVGHSWGAAAALAWALDAPEGTRGVLSISGATMPWGDGEPGFLTPVITSLPAAALGAGLVRVLTLHDGGRSAASRIFRPQEPPEGYLAHLQPELILRPESFRANTEDIQRLDVALTRMAPRYPSLRPPLEILHGAADRTTGASLHAVELSRQVPGARLELFDGIGHMLHYARPEAVTGAVERLAAG